MLHFIRFQRLLNCLAVFILSCSAAWAAPDSALLAKALKEPTRHLKHYQFDPHSPLSSRFGPPPASVLAYLREFDENPTYKGHTLTAAEKKVIQQSLAKLPPNLTKRLKASVTGIYFVDNFQGGGFTEWIVGERQKIYCFIALNPATLSNSLSAWVTQKDETVFRDPGNTGLKIDLGKEDYGLLYILLHEGAHVIDFVDRRTPYADFGVRDLQGALKSSPVTQGYWKNYSEPLGRYMFTLGHPLNFYGFRGGPSFSARDAGLLYGWLQQSPFISLYASKSWAEDFAELYAYHHLTRTLKKPYTITVKPKGKPAFSFSPLDSPLVKKRLEKLKPLLEQ